MAEEISVPPEVLETFLKIKRLVDATVEQLQTLPLQASANIAITSTIAASAEVASQPAVRGAARIPGPSVSATARPGVVQAKASIPTPTVTVTDEEIEEARSWIFATAAAIGARETMGFFADLEGMLQFVDRMGDLLP